MDHKSTVYEILGGAQEDPTVHYILGCAREHQATVHHILGGARDHWSVGRFLYTSDALLLLIAVTALQYPN